MKKLLCLLILCWPISALAQNYLPIDQFGRTQVFLPKVENKEVVVLLSPFSGWDKASTEAAENLQQQGYLVLGFDSGTYARDRAPSDDTCLYPTGLIEDALEQAQKRFMSGAYRPAAVIGLGDAGSFAAAIVLQSLPGTYSSAVGPDFCPRLALPKPLCLGERLQHTGDVYQPRSLAAITDAEQFYLAMSSSCAAVHKAWPAATPTNDAIAFIKQSLVTDIKEDAAQTLPALADLPLTLMRGAPDNPWLVVFYSGDGGWRDIDRSIGGYLNQQGYSVVGVDSLRAFWHEQPPAAVAADLQRILTVLGKEWRKDKIALVGYSFGADILPFVIPLMPPQPQLQLLALLAPGLQGSFEITVSGFLGHGDKRYNVVKAINALPPIKGWCFYGKDEAEDSACTKTSRSDMSVVALKGGHHFDKNYKELAQQLEAAMPF